MDPDCNVSSESLEKQSSTRLTFHGNPIAPETLLESLSDSSSLIELDLSSTKLNIVPECLAHLPALRILDLNDNTIESFDPVYETLLPNHCWQHLRVLTLDRNRLQHLPRGLFSLPELQVFSASENAIQFSGDVPISSPLGEVDLGTNRLKSSSLASLLRCATLTALDVSCNEIDEMPKSIPPLMQELSLSGNKCCLTVDTSITAIPACCCIDPYDPPCLFAPRLYIGSYGTAHNRTLLEHMHITHILTLGKRLRPLYPDAFTYLVVDIEDEASSNITDEFVPCFKFIDDALASLTKNNVLIHCSAGMSRSGTICAAYLIRTQRMATDEAIQYLRSCRRLVRPIPSFKQQLRLFETQQRQQQQTNKEAPCETRR